LDATTGVAEILNKPTIPTATSDLTNDGSDGVNPFITAADIPPVTGFVPYTGATANVDLGEYELKAGQVTLDTTPTGTAAVATTRWNDTIGSTETTLKGGSVVLKNGVDLVARVVNKVTPNTTLTKAAYQAVRISGAQGQRLAVAYAQANNDNNSADTIGIVCETIATNQEGFILTVGQLEEINTTGSLQGETWADGDVLYLSPTTAGRLTNIKPTGATGHIVVMGYVEYAHAIHGKIYVKIMNGWELDELHNVFINSPANNEGLFYDSADSLWKNETIASALGYTPVTNARTISTTAPLSGGGDLTANRTLSISQASTSTDGFLSSTNWNTFNGKQDALVSGTNIKTINGSSVLGSGDLVVGGTNIYGSDGTLTSDRTVTSNGNSLTILGGKETFAGFQRALWLKTSTTAKSSVELILENTFTTTGKIYELASYSDGTFNITNRTNSGLRLKIDNNYFQFHSSATSNANVLGTVASINALWFNQTSATATTSNYTLCNASGLTLLNAPTGGSIYFRVGNADRALLTNGGNLLINTTTDAGFKLDVNGTARVSGRITALNGANMTLTSNYAAEIGFNVNGRMAFGYNVASGSIIQALFASSSADLFVQPFGGSLMIGENVLPNASASVQINSTTKGFLPPRMTTTQKNAIATPAAGLVVYDTTLGKLCVRTAAAWETITSI